MGDLNRLGPKYGEIRAMEDLQVERRIQGTALPVTLVRRHSESTDHQGRGWEYGFSLPNQPQSMTKRERFPV